MVDLHSREQKRKISIYSAIEFLKMKKSIKSFLFYLSEKGNL